jgi:hypothetical protein
MLSRRVLVCGVVALAATVQGCDSSGPSPRTSGTWRGKRIDVYASEAVSFYSGNDQAEVQVGNHRVVIREEVITVDGDAKAVRAFSRVVIDVKPAAVIVTVDGAPLFT